MIDFIDNNVSAIITPVLLLAFSLVLFWLSFLCESRSWKFVRSIPGPPLIPLFGNALTFWNPEEILVKVAPWGDWYGDRFRVVLGNYLFLFIRHPDDVEKFLSSSTLIDKSWVYDFGFIWVGQGLATSSGTKWQIHRKLLEPAFRYKILDKFQKVMNDQASILVDIIKEKVADGQVIEINPLFARFTLDCICETSMGKKLNCQRENHPFTTATIKESGYLTRRLMNPLLHPDFIYNISPLGREEMKNRKVIHDFVDKVILERQAETKKMMEDEGKTYEASDDNDNVYWSEKKDFAFLDLLLHLRSNGDLTQEEVREETNTLMFAGYDSTGASMCWTVFLLGTHLDHQALVLEELDSVFGNDRNRPVTSADLANLKYLEYCIKESLRIYPSAPMIARRLREDFQLDEKTVVPAGVDILLSPFFTHRHPQFFPNPEEFQPSRHFPENVKERHPYAYIPFSAGPRNCVGYRLALTEIKLGLAHVFRNFQVSVLQPETVAPYPDFILRSKNNIRCMFEPRGQSS